MAPVVRRRDVPPEPRVAETPHDYADAFEFRVGRPEDRAPEQWVRAAIAEAHPAVRFGIVFAQTRLLRMRLGPRMSSDHVIGWRIEHSDGDVVVLRACGPLIHGTIVGRRIDEFTGVVSTFVAYQRPGARLVWAMVAPLHRTVARYLVRRAARTQTTSDR